MKPLIQKLPVEAEHSFVARTYRTPNFEVGWHQHIEYELILFTEGAGLSFVGNHVGEFETGDIYFLGSNLPHTFQKHAPELIASAIVIQFKDDLWHYALTQMPEGRAMKSLFDVSGSGLRLHAGLQRKLFPLIMELEFASGFKRVLLLGECLRLMAEEEDFTKLSTKDVHYSNARQAACIDRVFQYTIDSFRGPVALSQVAAIACMSVPAFCNYFKRSTKKTYIDFLNEVRVGHACTRLLETQDSVLDICYESGYNTMANFHKQFLKVKGLTPLQYRKEFTSRATLPQNNIGIIEE